MRIAYVQFKPVFGQIEENLNYLAALLANVAADLVVLPELCTTGYLFLLPEEVAHLSEAVPDGPTTQWFIKLCRDKGFNIVFGMAESHRHHFFNSAVVVSPHGYVGTYRKSHLYDTEKNVFRRGDTGFSVWQLDQVRVGVMICFDWFFPESMRVLALRGAQIVCHPTNLVMPYCQAAMQTRCLENGVFAVTANRIGAESRAGFNLTFTGCSQIVDTTGKVLHRAALDKEEVGIVEVYPAQALDKSVGAHNDRFTDRCPEFYREITTC